ncbi:hypothetical protein ACN47E_006060 [Coniothyrium glycines]
MKDGTANLEPLDHPSKHGLSGVVKRSGSTSSRDLLRHISPPPLKRRRTSPGACKRALPGPRSTVFLSGSSRPVINGPSRSFDGYTYTSNRENVEKLQPCDTLYRSVSFPTAVKNYSRSFEIPSRQSSVARSDRSSKPGSINKPTCVVCLKSLATRYDPIIACPSCDRPYHDGCRNSQLLPGVDPKCWRCYICRSGSRSQVVDLSCKSSVHADSLGQTKMNSSILANIAVEGALSRFQRDSSTSSSNNITKIVDFTAATQRAIFVEHPSAAVPPGHRRGHKRGPSISWDTVEISSASPGSRTESSTSRSAAWGQNQDVFVQAIVSFPIAREIPPTPTQRSSQITAPLVTIPTYVDPSGIEVSQDLETSPVRQSIEQDAPLAVPCSVCRTQRVIAQNGDITMRCQNCRNRSQMVETGKLEIPESPDDAASNESTVSWCSRVPSSTNVTQTSTSDIDPSSRYTSERLCDEENNVTAMDHVQLDEKAVNCESMIRKVVTKPNGHPRFESRQQCPVPLTSDDDVMSCENQRHCAIRGETSKTSSIDAVPTAVQPEPLTLPNVRLATSPHTFPTSTSIVAETGNPALVVHKKPHTIRELARMALVAADGSRLTASQIVDWVSKNSDHLRKGVGGWQNSMKAVLSRMPEFVGQKVGGSTMQYGFADAVLERKYRNEYGGYVFCTTVKTLESFRSLPDTSSEPAVLLPSAVPELEHSKVDRARKTVSLERDASRSGSREDAARAQQISEDLIFQASVGATPRDKNENPLDGSDLRGRASQHKMPIRAHIPSIETMTAEAKMKKIAEIKARPSRKSFFGSENRLGHVRWQQRVDIHDESDGAWKPVRAEHSGIVGDVLGTLDHEESLPTLREIFGLPAITIPMNDGQTELAFRDGTLVNGKLPRSRQLYRAGKLFGGELTIRTS